MKKNWQAVTVAEMGGIQSTYHVDVDAIVAVGPIEGLDQTWEFRRVFLQGGHEISVLNTHNNMWTLFQGEVPAVIANTRQMRSEMRP